MAHGQLTHARNEFDAIASSYLADEEDLLRDLTKQIDLSHEERPGIGSCARAVPS